MTEETTATAPIVSESSVTIAHSSPESKVEPPVSWLRQDAPTDQEFHAAMSQRIKLRTPEAKTPSQKMAEKEAFDKLVDRQMKTEMELLKKEGKADNDTAISERRQQVELRIRRDAMPQSNTTKTEEQMLAEEYLAAKDELQRKAKDTQSRPTNEKDQELEKAQEKLNIVGEKLALVQERQAQAERPPDQFLDTDRPTLSIADSAINYLNEPNPENMVSVQIAVDKAKEELKKITEKLSSESLTNLAGGQSSAEQKIGISTLLRAKQIELRKQISLAQDVLSKKAIKQDLVGDLQYSKDEVRAIEEELVKVATPFPELKGTTQNTDFWVDGKIVTRTPEEIVEAENNMPLVPVEVPESYNGMPEDELKALDSIKKYNEALEEFRNAPAGEQTPEREKDLRDQLREITWPGYKGYEAVVNQRQSILQKREGEDTTPGSPIGVFSNEKTTKSVSATKPSRSVVEVDESTAPLTLEGVVYRSTVPDNLDDLGQSGDGLDKLRDQLVELRNSQDNEALIEYIELQIAKLKTLREPDSVPDMSNTIREGALQEIKAKEQQLLKKLGIQPKRT